MSEDLKETTRLISPILGRPRSHRSVNTALERGSTVLFPSAETLYDDEIKPSYGIEGLSTQTELRRLIAELEGAQTTFLLPTGLSALTFAILAVLSQGDEVLCVNSCYGPIRRFLDGPMKRFGVRTTYVAPDLSPEALMAKASEATRLIILESPGSLTFEIQDIPAIAKAAKARGILTLCDNTYGAGILFKPLEQGVDLSMQALTKYIGGHSDILIGALSVKDKALAQKLDQSIRAYSFFASADESYLAIRGLRTAHLRLKESGQNGLYLAKWLQDHPLVERVLHPALPSHPGHEIFNRDFSAPNGLFSLILKGGPSFEILPATHAFLNALKLFGLGYSWGGYESLAIYFEPQLSYRAKLSEADHRPLEGAHIRLYIGLEDKDDLKADLEAALKVYETVLGQL